MDGTRSRRTARLPRPIDDVHSGAPRGDDYGHHVHTWLLGGLLEKTDAKPPTSCEGGAGEDHDAGEGGAVASADPVTSEVEAGGNAPPQTLTCETSHPVHCDTSTEAESDTNVANAKRRLRRAKRALSQAQRDVDGAAREKRRKGQQMMESFIDEAEKLRKKLVEMQDAHRATHKLLDEERAVVDTVTRRVDDLREQKLALEGRVEKLEEELQVAANRAKLLGGDLDSIKQCNGDDLDASIKLTMGTLSRMQHERSERGQRSASCVVCPLCRQGIEEKIRVIA